MPKGIYNRKTIEQPRVFTARESFTTVHDGTPISVIKGVTVREGHPLLLGREHLFVPQKVDYELDPEPDPEPDEELPPAAEAAKPMISLRSQK